MNTWLTVFKVLFEFTLVLVEDSVCNPEGLALCFAVGLFEHLALF